MNKQTIRNITATLLVGAGLALGQAAFAEAEVSASTTTTSTVTSDGTVSEFAPTGDTIVLKSTTSTEPMRYSYSKQTTIVDDAGQPVDVAMVRSGLPVQVMYVKEGDRMVARKIVVKKRTTTTTEVPVKAPVIERHDSTTTTTETTK
ncbi:MAG: hypothetical protein M3O82_06060 [Verrucomicrobiota bacterium]|nr:hypothetical protein [Verrucomicrobiota bacterium]